MLKLILKAALALALLFVGLLFYKANMSEGQPPLTVVTAAPAPTAGVFTIALGSCNRQDKAQDYWPTIGAHQPDAWLWLGDNVYSDTDDMTKMAADYQDLKTNANYAKFAATTDIYGIWDDHDYGKNDGGKEWPHKQGAEKLLLDFLDVPAAAEVRQRPGAYQRYDLMGEGINVRVILLDTRSFRDPLHPPTRDGDRYGRGPGDVLGDAQWAWLEQELVSAEAADFILIGSSIQVIPEDHGYEKWANFPDARQRLLDLVAQHSPTKVIFLSGDRHLAEVSRLEHGDHDFYEVTASGLTHSYEGADEANQHRISPLIGQKNYGLLHFFPTEGNARLLAEIRAIENDAVLANLALGVGADLADLSTLSEAVNPSQQIMPSELSPCPASPNCVSTQTDQVDKKRAPIAYTGTLAEAKQKLKGIIDSMARTKLRKEEDNYLHYTFKTFPIPFVDDVEFVFDEVAKEIHYRSASRVGHSDLGVNSKRMAKVVKAFNEQ